MDYPRVQDPWRRPKGSRTLGTRLGFRLSREIEIARLNEMTAGITCNSTDKFPLKKSIFSTSLLPLGSCAIFRVFVFFFSERGEKELPRVRDSLTIVSQLGDVGSYRACPYLQVRGGGVIAGKQAIKLRSSGKKCIAKNKL